MTARMKRVKPESAECEYDYNLIHYNPYESFMRHHLKHYGYYTGRNENYRNVFEDWERTHSYDLDNASDTEYENQALKDNDKDEDKGQEEQRSTQVVFSETGGKVVPKLKEPRSLYAVTNMSSSQIPRWPADMQVVPDKIEHLEYKPAKPEPLYQSIRQEKMPMPVPEGMGKTVYYNPPPNDLYFMRSKVGGCRSGLDERTAKLESDDDTTLLFESRFESGNLLKAVKVSENEYELHLRYDLYTDKHTQWFYFRIKNVQANVKYRFTIINLMKPGSLYNSGMRPLMYSEKDAKQKRIGWRRWGQEIKYYKNYLKRTDVKGDRNFYSLTWTCTFPHSNDTCYFSHCYPYTYSNLQDYLQAVQLDPVRSRYCKQRALCRTLAGNFVYILTITSPSKNPQEQKAKRAVVLTARVHPGETNSSWMMKGFLDYLTGDSADAKLLRDTFIFKVVPMLNPDGVIVGNYRCSLAGRDLNRNYKTVLKDSFPSVWHTKAMIKRLLDEREVTVYCDLHGHSRKQNVFIYGCDNKHNAAKRLRERVFPAILGKNAPTKFNYRGCKFKIQKSKEGTGRIFMWNMGIMNSYTMEATFCGTTLAENKAHCHFSQADFESMGFHFCDSLLDYCDPDESKFMAILNELKDKMRRDIFAHLQKAGTAVADGFANFEDVNLSDSYSSVDSSTSGSDSSVDNGLPVHLLALAPKLQKKKLKTRSERNKKNSWKFDEPPPEEKKVPAKTKPEGAKSIKYSHSNSPLADSKLSTRQGGRPPSQHTYYCKEHKPGEPTKNQYLEALTNAYLKNGILPSGADEIDAMPTLRYSGGKAAKSLFGGDGALCAHHEATLASQLGSQLAGLNFDPGGRDWGHSKLAAARQEAQTPLSLSGARPGSVRHLVAVSAHQQRQQDALNAPGSRKASALGRPQTGQGTPLRTHPSPFDELFDQRKYSDFVRRGYSAKSKAESRGSSLSMNVPAATSITVYPASPNNGKEGTRNSATGTAAVPSGRGSIAKFYDYSDAAQAGSASNHKGEHGGQGLSDGSQEYAVYLDRAKHRRHDGRQSRTGAAATGSSHQGQQQRWQQARQGREAAYQEAQLRALLHRIMQL